MLSLQKIQRSGLLFLFFLVCAGILSPENVSAADPVTMPTGLTASIAEIASKVISFLNLLTWIFFIFLNFLLDPKFIFNLDRGGSAGGLMEMLNTIWQLSRDLMNIAFALMLVGAAIYTVITAKKEFIAEHGKKFLLAVVLVNFSWFVPRIIIDISNIAAATVYGIPSMLPGPETMCKYRTSANEDPACTVAEAIYSTGAGSRYIYSCPCRVLVDARMFLKESERTDLETDAMKAAGWMCQGSVLCYRTKAWDKDIIAGHSAILNGLILNHGRLQSMARVPGPTDGSSVTAMVNFILKEGVILLIHVALFFPLMAMVIAFMIRIPILWLTMAFMPFVFLGMAIPNNEYTGMTKKIWEQFLKAAFLPAAIAVPLTIGFIMVNAGSKLTADPTTFVTIRLIDSVDNLWELLWWIMTLGVLWVGTFFVFEQAGGLYAKTAGTIKNYGEAWGKFAVKAPLAVRGIPALGGKTALEVLNMANPHNLNHMLSRPGGIMGGHGGLGGAASAARHAAGRSAGPSADIAKLNLIDGHIRDLKIALDAAGADATRKQAALDTFKTNMQARGITLELDAADIKGSLHTFLDAMKSTAPTPVLKTKVDTLKATTNTII